MKVLELTNVKILQNTNSQKFEIRLKNNGTKKHQLGDAVLLEHDDFLPKIKNSHTTYYVVKPCDTLEKVCKKFDLSKDWFCKKNKCKQIFAGQIVIVEDV